jgi:hypothetical protein
MRTTSGLGGWTGLLCGVIGIGLLGMTLPRPCRADSVADNFDDGTINSALWVYGGQSRSNSGGPGDQGPWTHSVNEVLAPDGYLNMHVEGPETGDSNGAEAWVRSAYDYRDGQSHTMTFTWERASTENWYNHFLIQITDGYIPPDANLHWSGTAEGTPGTTDILWGTGGIVGDPSRGSWSDTFPKQTWSIAIDPSGIARLFDGPDATGNLLHQDALTSTGPWYVRFMVSDGTSAGHGAGDCSLNLYNYSQSSDPGVPEPISLVSGLIGLGMLGAYLRTKRYREGRREMAVTKA